METDFLTLKQGGGRNRNRNESRVVPDIRLAGYPAFFDIRYPAGYPVSVAGYPARNTI